MYRSLLSLIISQNHHTMKAIGKKILESRKHKGYSQEKLAELSQVNLRTIQRIENNESNPHGKTLKMVCNVLEIDMGELLLVENENGKKPLAAKIINWIFLIALNIVIMMILGWTLIDSEANLNSRFGGLLISFLLPYFIVSLTPQMSSFERTLKYGIGLTVYLLIGIYMTFAVTTVFLILIVPLIIALSVLYYGNSIVKFLEK